MIYYAIKKTWFQDIFQLQPSHFLEITKNNIRIRKYYKIEDHIDESKDENKASLKNEQKKLFKALELSFKQHSIYDVKEEFLHLGVQIAYCYCLKQEY